MIYLITGLPGHSKTLNAIKFVDETFKGRDIYYSGINELTLPWIETDPRLWHELPQGSVIVIDECQRVFPPRKQASAIPDYIQQLETHRHGGYDLVLITQHPNFIDHHVRKLVETHHHYLRQFGTNTVFRYEKTGCFDPNSTNDKNAAVRKVLRIDQSYFGKYKSAEVHTVKRRIPMVIYLPVLFLMLSGFMVWLFLRNMTPEPAPQATATQDQQVAAAPGQVLDGLKKRDIVTAEEYLELQTPRIPGFAFTAPVYDGLREPKAYPWPNCVNSRVRGCRCYSQQATRLDVSQQVCHEIINRGLFDYAKDSEQAGAGTAPAAADLVAVHLRAAEIYESMRTGKPIRKAGEPSGE
jgi:zona occludens toxin